MKEPQSLKGRCVVAIGHSGHQARILLAFILIAVAECFKGKGVSFGAFPNTLLEGFQSLFSRECASVVMSESIGGGISRVNEQPNGREGVSSLDEG